MQSTSTNQRTTDPTTLRIAPFWLSLLLAVIGCAVYAGGLSGPFVFDDVPEIVEDPTIRSLWPLGDVVGGTNRPVLKLSFALNWAVGGGSVRGYRLTNVAIHVLAALVLFGIVRRTLLREACGPRSPTAAAGFGFAVALLWLVHPLQTESVTYVFQRGESLMGLFFLLALYATLRAATGERRGAWLGVAVGAAALAFGTKEVAVVLPLVVLLYDRAFLAGSFRGALGRRGLLYAAFASLWLVTAALVAGLLFKEGTTAGFGVEGHGPLDHALAQPGVVLHYLVMACWPRSLCLDYGWVPRADFLGLAVPVIVMGALVGATVRGLWRNAWYGVVGAWFFLVLAPTSSFLPIRDLAVEHRMYLPLAAVVVTAVAGVHAAGPPAFRRGLPLLLVLAAAALATGTVRRNAEYADAVTLWRTVTERAPGNPRGHLLLGNALRQAGRPEEAEAAFAAAIRIDEHHVPALTNLGALRLSRGDSAGAIACFERVVRIAPGPVHHTNLGNAYLQAGRVDDAILLYRQALAVQPGFALAQSNFGVALLEKGRVNEAILHFRNALAVEPDDVTARVNLGRALLAAQEPEEALRELRAALERQPDGAAEIRAAIEAIEARAAERGRAEGGDG